MLKIYRTYNPTVKFSKNKYNNKLLGGVILVWVTQYNLHPFCFVLACKDNALSVLEIFFFLVMVFGGDSKAFWRLLCCIWYVSKKLGNMWFSVVVLARGNNHGNGWW